MISVSIAINGTPIYTRTAVNVTEREGVTEAVRRRRGDRYQLDDGTTVYHYRENGAVALAIQMLETIEEMGVREREGE